MALDGARVLIEILNGSAKRRKKSPEVSVSKKAESHEGRIALSNGLPSLTQKPAKKKRTKTLGTPRGRRAFFLSLAPTRTYQHRNVRKHHVV
jgi:hypothetical protein